MLADEGADDGDLEDEESYTDGRRAARLSADMSPGGRFSPIGISSATEAFAENGPLSDSASSRESQRWRTRERRRAPRPVSTRQEAEKLLVAAVGHPIETLRASVRRGRPTVERRAVRAALAAAVSELRKARRVSAGALANALSCDPATVWRLAQSGAPKNARSAHIDSEGEFSAAA